VVLRDTDKEAQQFVDGSCARCSEVTARGDTDEFLCVFDDLSRQWLVTARFSHKDAYHIRR